MKAASIERGAGTRRQVEWLITLSALGEVAVGIAVAAFPAVVTGFLLSAPIQGAGIVAARMAGVAVTALGIAWWAGRHGLGAERLRAIAPGYLVYNFGIGLLFLAHTWTSDHILPASLIVAAAHLLFGCAFVVLVGRTRAGV